MTTARRFPISNRPAGVVWLCSQATERSNVIKPNTLGAIAMCLSTAPLPHLSIYRMLL